MDLDAGHNRCRSRSVAWHRLFLQAVIWPGSSTSTTSTNTTTRITMRHVASLLLALSVLDLLGACQTSTIPLNPSKADGTTTVSTERESKAIFAKDNWQRMKDCAEQADRMLK